MDNIKIRPIKPQDYADIRAVDILTQQQYLGAQWETLSPTKKEKHLVSRKTEYESNVHSGYSFVALFNGHIIGFLFAYETQPFLKNIYVRYIGINPTYQKNGIGLLLYNELIKKAQKNKIQKITAQINLDNPQSIKLHEKAGFVLQTRIEATYKIING